MEVVRDIGSRIGRYRLTRYAQRSGRSRWLPWVLAALAVWLLWATAISDRSLFRIWRLRHERASVQRELAQVQRDQARMEADLESPGATRALAERRLREESGMARPGEIVYRVRGDGQDSTSRK